MDGFSKLLDILKIPLKVLLPASCLFSGFLSFLPDKILTKIGLLEWKNTNSFVIGLVFIISISLILVYVVFYVFQHTKSKISELTLYPRTLKNISQMSDMELSIIIDLYRAPGYSGTVDWGHPVVKGLLARNYIYAGDNAYVSLDVFTEKWPMKVTLQPFVYRTLNHYQAKVKRKLEKLEHKLAKNPRAAKAQRLQSELNNMQESYNAFFA